MGQFLCGPFLFPLTTILAFIGIREYSLNHMKILKNKEYEILSAPVKYFSRSFPVQSHRNCLVFYTPDRPNSKEKS